jgi:tRNA dimethylallyltransferase
MLHRERGELYARIEVNVLAMFARGVEDEVAALPEEMIGPTAAMTLGLREVQALLRRELTREEATSRMIQATRRYARRQMTWFRNQHAFPLLSLSALSEDQAIREALRQLQND